MHLRTVDHDGTTQIGPINYDRGASEYASHRRIHGGVLRELCVRGRLGPGSTVLEVGCGTGKYVSEMVESTRCSAYGLDPSAGMLAHARAHPEPVTWCQGRAEQLPAVDDSLHLVFSVDVIHHVTDKAAFYREAARVLRHDGWVCTVTDSADIIRRREILSGCFPETVEIELTRYPRLAQLEAWMAAAGLQGFEVVTVEESYEVTSAQPFRDKAYSSLHLISEEAWQAGLEHLERDLACGPVRGVSRYACMWARK